MQKKSLMLTSSKATISLSLVLLLFTTAGLLPLTNVWAYHSGEERDDDNSEVTQEKVDGYNVIRGSGIITGTDDKDFMIGDVTDDDMLAKEGNDIVQGDLGIDQIYGARGDDSIQGGPGNNQLFGGSGNDNLIGGVDDDIIDAGPGEDHMLGDFGNDVLRGGPGADYFGCGDGLDIILDFDQAKGDVRSVDCELIQ
jgi:Ca2+-binding RTX toxin-like protein